MVDLLKRYVCFYFYVIIFFLYAIHMTEIITGWDSEFRTAALRKSGI